MAWTLTQAGLFLAVAFSGVAWLGLCDSCHSVSLSLPFHLEMAGLVLYGTLFVLSFWPPRVPVYGGIWGAAGAQLVLAGYLVASSQTCGVCSVVLAGAMLAAGAGWAALRPGWFLPVVCLFSGMLLGLVLLKTHQRNEAMRQATWMLAIADELSERQLDTKRSLFVLTDPNCGFCESFKRETLPGLQRHFEGKVEIQMMQLPVDCPVPAFYLPSSNGREAVLLIGQRSEEELTRLLESHGYRANTRVPKTSGF